MQKWSVRESKGEIKVRLIIVERMQIIGLNFFISSCLLFLIARFSEPPTIS
jgi:hypothetical protein